MFNIMRTPYFSLPDLSWRRSILVVRVFSIVFTRLLFNWCIKERAFRYSWRHFCKETRVTLDILFGRGLYIVIPVLLYLFALVYLASLSEISAAPLTRESVDLFLTGYITEEVWAAVPDKLHLFLTDQKSLSMDVPSFPT